MLTRQAVRLRQQQLAFHRDPGKRQSDNRADAEPGSIPSRPGVRAIRTFVNGSLPGRSI